MLGVLIELKKEREREKLKLQQAKIDKLSPKK